MLNSKVLGKGSSVELQKIVAALKNQQTQLRQVPQISGKQRDVTVPAGGTANVYHGLSWMPKGVMIMVGDNNAITLTNRTRELITLANSAGTDATLTIWIY